MKISAVIPAYNCGRYLDDALNSVVSGTLVPDEVLVVDDGSTDVETPAVLQRWGARVRWHRQANGGIGAARNTGVRLASHEWVAFLDADDLWLPSKLQRQVEVCASDPTAALISTAVEMFISADVADSRRVQVSARETHPTGFLASSVLVQRSVFESVGFFSQELRAGEFIEWCARLRTDGIVCRHIQAPLVRRRIHDANTGRRDPGSQADYVRAVRSVLARRRQLGPDQSA